MPPVAAVVRLSGGLGNQLFQYAFGKAVSIRNGVPLILDAVSGFPRDPYRRSYALGPFAIDSGFLPELQNCPVLADRVRFRLGRWFSGALPMGLRRYRVERDPSRWDPDISRLHLSRRTYFDGHWQHEEYFRDVRDRLVNELTLRRTPSDACLAIADRMAGQQAVALHVRCLRHVTAFTKSTPRLAIDPAYYERAVSCVMQRLSNPRLYVFADDVKWARDNVAPTQPCEYVEPGLADYEHLWLMSRCQAFIIANSTFSWWAAWISNHPDKYVIAPQSGLGQGLWSVPPGWHLL